jgi:hypothetical protein
VDLFTDMISNRSKIYQHPVSRGPEFLKPFPLQSNVRNGVICSARVPYLKIAKQQTYGLVFTAV